jgi:hypothetical protein
MRITYRLTFEDYCDAARARNAGHWRSRAGVTLAVSVLLCGYWMASGRNVRVGRTCLLIVALLVVVYLLTGWLRNLRFRNSYRKGAEPGFDGKEFTVDILEEGIQSPDTPSKEEWSQFSKYSESNNSFILYRNNSIQAIFPKRAFDVDGMNSFRRLLQEKLGRS